MTARFPQPDRRSSMAARVVMLALLVGPPRAVATGKTGDLGHRLVPPIQTHEGWVAVPVNNLRTGEHAGNRLGGRLGRVAFDNLGAGAPGPAATAATKPGVLELGVSGPLVETLQRTLNARLTPAPNLGVDGDFGPATQAAVVRFQEQHQLPANGAVGPATWKALTPLVAKAPPVPPPAVVNAEKLPRQPPDSLDGPPFVTCKAWAVGDGRTGQLLWGDHEKTPLDIASTTKIMTAYVVLKLAADKPAVLDETVVFSRRADRTKGSTAGIRAGERLPVRELLYGLLLPSGNDASVALAEHFGDRFAAPENGSAPDDRFVCFVAEMNRTARSLGMKETTYVNTHGLTAPGHRASCRDLLRLSFAALKLPRFARYVRTRQHGYTIVGPGGCHRNLLWKNTNRLLAIEGYVGVKTGTTNAAGACLVSAGCRGDDRLIVVVLGASSSTARYVDTRNLYRWAWHQRGHKG